MKKLVIGGAQILAYARSRAAAGSAPWDEATIALVGEKIAEMSPADQTAALLELARELGITLPGQGERRDDKPAPADKARARAAALAHRHRDNPDAAPVLARMVRPDLDGVPPVTVTRDGRIRLSCVAKPRSLHETLADEGFGVHDDGARR